MGPAESVAVVLRYLGFCLARISRSYPIQLGLNRPFLAPIVAVTAGFGGVRCCCSMVKRIPIGDGKSYRVHFKSRPVKVAEADETDGYLDGTVKLGEAIGNFQAVFGGLAASGFLGSLPRSMPQRMKDVLDADGGPARW